MIHEEGSGVIILELSIEAFNALGFAFGDSVDISVSNGKSYTDVPYYSGYYTPIDGLLVCGYPGSAHVLITRNYGSSTWEEFVKKILMHES